MTTIDLSTITLGKGSHKAGAKDPCLLELCSYIAGDEWSDHPPCVSSVLGAYGRNLNDVLPDDLRQALLPMAERLLNTAGDGQDERRSYMALDWLVRVYTPTWMRLVPALCEQAALLEAAHEVVDLNTAAEIGTIVREAAAQSAAAGAAARDAARAAARDALAPTVLTLQQSAIALMDRLIDPSAS